MEEQELLKHLLAEHSRNIGHISPVDEFREDVMRFLYVSRLLKKYHNDKNLNFRLLVNHITILYNTFGQHTTGVLFVMVDKDYHPYLISILEYFGRIPEDKRIQYFTDYVDVSEVIPELKIIEEIEQNIEI